MSASTSFSGSITWQPEPRQRRGRMNRQDTHRFVQQYVERQKAYLTTYTTVEHLLNERYGTPSKPRLRSDEFGFETPVLHPRVPENAKAAQSQLTVQVGRSKSRTHGVEPGAPPNQGPGPLGKASSEIQHPTQGKKDKPKSKRKKASSPIDTDNERTASRSLSLLGTIIHWMTRC